MAARVAGAAAGSMRAMAGRAISANDAAYSRLLQDIVRSVLVPGERFSEQSLVGRYGFGKASIRAALVRLRHDGLVEGAPRQAHQVTMLTVRDADEINAMRVLLEPEAARLAAERRTEAQSRRIEQIARKTAQADIDRRPGEFLGTNQSFHLAVAEASRSRRLASSIEGLIIEGERVLYALLRLRPVASHFGANNIEVARAIAQQEPGCAEELMRSLILDGKTFFADIFELLPIASAG